MSDPRTDKLDDLMDRFVFGLLGEAAARRVREKIPQDPAWQLAYEAAVKRKAALASAVHAPGASAARGAAGAVGVTPAPLAGVHRPGAKGQTILAAARRKEGAQTRARRMVSGSLGGLAAAAAVVIAALWIHVAVLSAPTRVLRLLGQTQLASGSTASVRALVAGLSGKPLAGVPVTFALRGLPGGKELVLGRFTSDAAGSASGQVRVPALEGPARLAAYTDESRFSQVEAAIKIERSCRVYLSTDKPIYKPGQTIHMRCLVLRKPDMTPDAGGAAEFTVTDPAGNVIFKHDPALSEYGLAWADLGLDDLVTPGRYTVKAAAGSDASEQAVEVFQYKLPAFAVRLKMDKPYYLPGQTISGKIDMQYHFGKPVSGGKVELELSDRAVASQHVLKKVSLLTDEAGEAGFEIMLPRTLVGLPSAQGMASLLLSARAADAAGQENVGYLNVPVSGQDIRLAAVAENGAAARGGRARLYVVSSYPDGRPAKTILDIETLGQSVRTDDAGVAVVEMAPMPSRLSIRARDDLGKTGSAEVSLPAAEGEALVLRSDKPIYTAGGTMKLEVLAGTDGEVFVDMVKDRQTVLAKALTVAGGRGALAVDLPAGLSGTLKIHAYRLSDQGEWVGLDLLVIVKPAGQLKVDVKADRGEYRPGGDAKLNFLVTLPTGLPVAAALSLSAVDEAVYSVQQAAPGLEGLLAGLDEQILLPAIEAHGFSPSLMEKDEEYACAVLAAAVPPPGKPQTRTSPALDRLLKSGAINQSTVDRLRRMDRDRALAILQERPELREQLGPQLLQEVFGIGAEGRKIDLNNKQSAERAYYAEKRGAENLAVKATILGGLAGITALLALLMIALSSRDPGRPPGGRVLPSPVELLVIVAIIVLLVIVLMPGLSKPRELARRSSDVGEVLALAQAEALGESGALRADVRLSAGAPVAPLVLATPAGTAKLDPSEGDASAQPARTRTFFPETMLWRPQIITDEHGKAELSVPLADSITTWRLAGSAVSKAGQLGKVDGSVRVFQPFFVDVDAPIALTQGDEYSLPVVLYNYAAADLEVSLKAKGEGGLSLLDAPQASIRVKVGEVKRHLLRVKADAIGQAAITLDASSGGVADSIRRQIAIDPPGLPASLAVSGTVADGEQTVEVPIPPDAVPGSLALQLKVYPSTFSELLDGMENIFRMPNGCFEQTSSTTYPNVMALSYLKAHKLDKPEISAKASRYIQLGYQRLLSFEVRGGGFEWFGHSPANVVLTAYGLMEFADMAKVQAVDTRVLSRTAEWLASRQDPRGAWRFESGCFHEPFTGGDSGDLAVTAYVTWALAAHDPASAAARKGDLYIAQNAPAATSPRTIALCACALLAADKNSPDGLALLRRLADLALEGKESERYWTDAGSGARGDPRRARISGPGGYDDVATTAMAVLAMAGRGEYSSVTAGALRWIAARKDPQGTWGTTQATVLALKALLAGSGAPVRRTEEATITVRAGGEEGGPELARLAIQPKESDIVHTLRIPVEAGAGTLRLRLDGRGAAGMGYQLALRYHSRNQQAPPGSPLAMEVRYDRTQLQVNQSVSVEAVVRNRSPQVARMLLADIGTPPGFAVDPTGLEKARSEGKIDRYTLTARGVIVYIGSIGPNQELPIRFAMIARTPLKALAAPTKVYAYYAPHEQAAVPALTFQVK